MLVEFSIENYRSISEKQSINFLCDNTLKDSEEPIANLKNAGINLLKAAVIYGANSSGKSNILKGLYDLIYLMLFSEKEFTYGEKIHQIKPFLLTSSSRLKPSAFEISFIVNSVKYTYCLVLDKNKIFEERLESYPKGTKI